MTDLAATWRADDTGGSGMSRDLVAIKAELRTLLEEAPDGPPWIRRWESLDVHGIRGDGVFTNQRNIDLAVAAVNALPALLADTPSVEPLDVERLVRALSFAHPGPRPWPGGLSSAEFARVVAGAYEHGYEASDLPCTFHRPYDDSMCGKPEVDPIHPGPHERMGRGRHVYRHDPAKRSRPPDTGQRLTGEPEGEDVTDLRTKAGRRMAAALEDEIDYMGAVETILAIEAEATAAAEQRLRERIETLPDTHCPLCVDGDGDAKSGLVLRFSVLNALLDTPPPASPRQGEPVEGLDEVWKAAEAALPENVGPEGWRLMVKQTDPDDDEPDQPWCASAVSPAFYLGENDDDIRVGYGLTPAAALRALTTALRARQ